MVLLWTLGGNPHAGHKTVGRKGLLTQKPKQEGREQCPRPGALSVLYVPHCED